MRTKKTTAAGSARKWPLRAKALIVATLVAMFATVIVTQSAVATVEPGDAIENITPSGDAESGTAGVSMSDSGRWVAYASAATNLTPDAPNGYINAFLHDRLTDSTINLTPNGDDHSRQALVSGDGNRVLIVSSAANLTPDPNPSGVAHLYLYDVASGNMQRITTAHADGNLGRFVDISDDGTRVVFTSVHNFSNPNPSSINTKANIWIESVGLLNISGSAPDDANFVAISGDGDSALFGTFSGTGTLYRTDVTTGSTAPLAAAPSGVTVLEADLSDDGALAALRTLENGPNGYFLGLRVLDRTDQTAITFDAVPTGAGGPGQALTIQGIAMTDDGQHIFYARLETSVLSLVWRFDVGAGTPPVSLIPNVNYYSSYVAADADGSNLAFSSGSFGPTNGFNNVNVMSEGCNNRAVTVDIGMGQVPTTGDDVIVGTNAADTIDGLGGEDHICGGDGDDTITGGDDDDQVFGGDGDDTIKSGDGVDFVWGDDGDDTIFGEAGQDVLRGNNGNDQIWGGHDKDRIFGHGGNDTIYGGFGNDRLSGGSGNDTIEGLSGSNTIWGGSGDDFLSGANETSLTPGIDTISGNGGFDHCDGKTGIDSETNCEVTFAIP